MFKVEMLKNKKKKWFFRIKTANNGSILCTSESYSSRTAARRTASKIKDNLRHSGPALVETEGDK